MDSNVLAGRILILIMATMFAWIVAFKNTPQLDQVKDAWIFRIAMMMMVGRAIKFILIDMFGLFPL